VKQLAIITLLAAVVASGQSDATPVASKAECLHVRAAHRGSVRPFPPGQVQSLPAAPCPAVLYSSTCSSAATINTDEYTIVQTGRTVRVTLASVPTYVGLADVNPDGSFAASGPWTTGICNVVTVLAATPTGGVIGASVPASAGIATTCQGAFSCETTFNGVLARVR
jgi:hypothetical protein